MSESKHVDVLWTLSAGLCLLLVCFNTAGIEQTRSRIDMLRERMKGTLPVAGDGMH